jgi:hypothetical protein
VLKRSSRQDSSHETEQVPFPRDVGVGRQDPPNHAAVHEGDHISEWHREVAGNPELKRILLKSTSTEATGFTAEEWFEFRLLAISLFHIFQSHFVHQTLNVGSVELSKINIHYAQSVISSWPAWRRFWEEEVSSGIFLSGFVGAVDGSGGADYTYMATQRDIGAI